MSITRFYPIDPSLKSDGSFAVLRPFLSEEEAKPVEINNPPTMDDLNMTHVVQQEIDVALAAQFSLTGFFSTGGTTSCRAMHFDFLTYVDRYGADMAGGKQITATRWGVGLRVNLLVSQMDAKFSLNLGTVAAAVELRLASARYEILTPGLGGSGSLEVINGCVPSLIDDFKPDTKDKIGRELPARITKYIADHSKSIRPVPLAVSFRQVPSPFDDAQAIAFAIRAIGQRHPLQQCVADGPLFARRLLETAYLKFGIEKEDEMPTRTQARKASDWLAGNF